MLALLSSHRKQCPSADSPSCFPRVEILTVHFFSLLTADFPISDAGCLCMAHGHTSFLCTQYKVGCLWCALAVCIIIILYCLFYSNIRQAGVHQYHRPSYSTLSPQREGVEMSWLLTLPLETTSSSSLSSDLL